MENQNWIRDFLKDLLAGIQTPEKAERVIEDYFKIKETGKLSDLLDFLEREYEKDILYSLESYLYSITNDRELYLICVKTRLELNAVRGDDLFLETVSGIQLQGKSEFMENQNWIRDFLKDLLASIQTPEKAERVIEDYFEIKETGKLSDLLDFLEREYEKDILYSLEYYLYSITNDREFYPICAKTRLELEAEQADDLFLEINLFEQVCMYRFREGKRDFAFEWKWNQYLGERMEQLIEPVGNKLTSEEREDGPVVLVTQQLLTEAHAPTRLILEMARIFISVLHKEVLLLVAGVPADVELLKNIGLDANGTILNFNYNLNGQFSYKYRGVSIQGYQLMIKKDNVNEMRELMRAVYRMKPQLVWNFAGNTYYTGLMKNFTTYIYTKCSSGYPAVKADAVVNYIPVTSPEDLSDKRYLEAGGTRVKEIEFLFPYEKPWQPAKRNVYGIAEHAFCLGIVGNRLEFDCKPEFLAILGEILNDMKEVCLIFYGELADESRKKIEENIGHRTRIIYLGARRDLINWLGMMDLFINPPRLGGGNGAAMSMSLGIPVLTVDEGDVASVAGPDFIVRRLEEFPALVKRYRDDSAFRERQSRKALQRIEQMTTSDEELGNILQQIINLAGEEI